MKHGALFCFRAIIFLTFDMLDLIKYDFCDIEIYDQHLIVTMHEGTLLEPSHNQILLNVVDTYFRKKSFVYITHRKYSYSVNPAIYFETSKIDNLKGFAIVASNYNAKGNAEIERLFLAKPMEVFRELDEAIAWAKEIIETENTLE